MFTYFSKFCKICYRVDPTCPHRRCQVTWRRDRQEFLCPCHGSTFDLEGSTLKGPANEGLKRYKIEIYERKHIFVAIAPSS